MSCVESIIINNYLFTQGQFVLYLPSSFYQKEDKLEMQALTSALFFREKSSVLLISRKQMR